MTLGLRGRLVISYLTIIILGVGGLVVRFGLLEQQRILAQSQNELELQAFLLASPLSAILEDGHEDFASPSSLKQAIDNLNRPANTRLTLLTLAGEPIYDSHFPVQDIPNQYHQPEIQYALINADKPNIRYETLAGEETLFAAAPVRHDESIIAVLQLSTPTEPFYAQIRQNWLILLATALLIIVVTVAVSLWLANYIVKPIQTMHTAALRLATGDLAQRIPVAGKDELTDLAHAFNTMASRLQTMMARQQKFVANASHELRTPITNIKLRAEALLNGALQDAPVAERFLSQIEHETDRMEELTRHLLALSRLDVDPALTLRPLLLAPFLNAVVENFTPLANLRGVSLSLNVPAGLPALPVDAMQLRQVFDNLLGNALKFTPAGGQVVITARHTAKTVEIAIADTGPGILPEDLSQIFDRFYRTDKARTRAAADPGGFGLGLAIVQGIVQAHGGSIRAESLPDQGATFTLQFPLPPAGVL